ncbi:unnamed protein product [Hyaloperonospora brassicae]|uniref:FYVE-type domain-containing protein n=1 Tax=Hyaloperonospora brassicae TaxID=162125 RepID=A0AAV0TS65_HYABA|nr:unnamed protein product [Hyaloperonospora brassicae]
MQLRFPLPAGYFAKFDLLPDEVQEHRLLASDIIRETKREFDRYVKNGRNRIDSRVWKLAKSKDQLHCYRRRGTEGSAHQLGLHSGSGTSRHDAYAAHSSHLSLSSPSPSEHSDLTFSALSMRSTNDGEPSRKSIQPLVIGYGVVHGTVDDLVYGLYQSSTDEMKTLASYLGDDSLIDCAVLKTIRQTRTSYLGLKWKLSRTVGGNRDCCYMEYVGVSEDAKGQHFGYHVLESVPVYNCPHFEDNSIVRANVSFCFIFRPGKLADQVEVFMQGAYDSSSDVLTAGGVGDFRSTMDMLFNLPSTMVGAEAKKISAMVAKQSSALLSASSTRQSSHHCFICRARWGLLSSHSNCQTCGAVICSKCRIRVVTFSRRGKIKVACCKMCMVMVRDQSPFAGEELEQQPARPKQPVAGETRLSLSSNCNSVSAKQPDPTNASVSTMSLTDSEYSASYQSWHSSSMSSMPSDRGDSFDGSSSTFSSSVLSVDRKMPAVLERPPPPRAPVTYQSEQQRQYEQQQLQMQQFLMRQRMKQNVHIAGAPPIPSQRPQPTTREGLYNKMLELRVQAERAYDLTNQNASMINSQR